MSTFADVSWKSTQGTVNLNMNDLTFLIWQKRVALVFVC